MRITDKGKLASAKGFANENRLLAALLERGYNASLVDLPHSPYDIVVERVDNEVIRLQVKTVTGSGRISFSGGVRGGADRKPIPGVKKYKQDRNTSDAVVGVSSTRNNGDTQIDFYFIPTIYIETLTQESISINKVKFTKNKWELMGKCRDRAYVEKVFGLS